MEYSDSAISLLFVDDDSGFLESARGDLERTGDYTVATAPSAKDALRMIQEKEFDIIISDYQMPEMNGIEFLEALRAQGNTFPFILFAGRGRDEIAIEALNAGADYYLRKGGRPGVRFGELQNVIRQAVEKSRGERQFIKQEQRMADFIHFLPDAIFAIDNEGAVIAWNRAIEKMTGIPASDMLGRDNYEYALPFYGKRRPTLIDLVLHDDLSHEVCYPVLNRNNPEKITAEIFVSALYGGRGAHLWFTASPLYDAEGAVTGAIESIRDISENKQSEGLYQTVFENTGTAMLILEDDTTIFSVNGEMEKISGYSREEMERTAKWSQLVAEEDLERMLEYHHLRRIDPDSVPKSYEFRMIRKNGEIRTAKITASLIPGTKRSVVSVVDITRQKEEENQLKLTQFSVDNASDGIFWADTEGNFFMVNKSAQDLFGYSEEDLLQMSIPDLSPEFPKDRFREFWNRARAGGSLLFEATVRKKGGEDSVIEINVVHLNFEGQEFECGFVRDINERKQAENALKMLNKKLNLLSSVTRHDIINQISGLLIFEELLKENLSEEKFRDYLKPMIDATETIERIIVFTRDYQDLGVHGPAWQSVASAVRLAESQLSDNGSKIITDTGTLEIYADPMFEKVFYNLFENAIRHGEHVTTMNISFYEREGDGVIVIEDNGVGVPAVKKERIFEYGVGKNTGFGLFLSKEIVEITGLSIAETGTEGTGACFEITVPGGKYRFGE